MKKYMRQTVALLLGAVLLCLAGCAPAWPKDVAYTYRSFEGTRPIGPPDSGTTTYLIHSLKELEAFQSELYDHEYITEYTELGPGPVYRPERLTSGYLADHFAKYDSDYFKEHYLVAVATQTESGSHFFRVDCVQYTEAGQIEIAISTLNDMDGGTEDVGTWLFLFELSRDDGVATEVIANVNPEVERIEPTIAP